MILFKAKADFASDSIQRFGESTKVDDGARICSWSADNISELLAIPGCPNP